MRWVVRCWQVRIDPTRKCVHVNLVKKSNVPGEEEYLFAPCKDTFSVCAFRLAKRSLASPLQTLHSS